MKAPTMQDTRGNKSTTLFAVTAASLALLGRFLAPLFGDYPDVSALDFGGAFGLIWAVWQGREYKQKDLDRVQ